jgi:hypothetical protein
MAVLEVAAVMCLSSCSVTQAPFYVFAFGNADGTERRRHAVRDARAMEELGTRSGATALAYANLTSKTMEAARKEVAAMLADVPEASPVAPLVLLHYSGDGFVDEFGETQLVLCDDGSGDTSDADRLHSLSKLILHVAHAMRGRGTLIVTVDLTRSYHGPRTGMPRRSYVEPLRCAVMLSRLHRAAPVHSRCAIASRAGVEPW